MTIVFEFVDLSITLSYGSEDRFCRESDTVSFEEVKEAKEMHMMNASGSFWFRRGTVVADSRLDRTDPSGQAKAVGPNTVTGTEESLRRRGKHRDEPFLLSSSWRIDGTCTLNVLAKLEHLHQCLMEMLVF